MVKITKNLIPLILILAISINIFLMYITVNTYQHLKSEIKRMTPQTITTIKETVKVIEKECIPCLWEDTPAE